MIAAREPFHQMMARYIERLRGYNPDLLETFGKGSLFYEASYFAQVYLSGAPDVGDVTLVTISAVSIRG